MASKLASPAGSMHILEVPFESRSVANSLGARWVPDVGWAYRGEVVPKSLEHWLPKPYSWGAWLQHDLNKLGPGQSRASRDTGEIKLRPDQEEDANKILAAFQGGAPEFMVASDVGVGKTVTTWAAIRRLPGVRNVLIVCPLSVVPHWRRTIHLMGDGGRRICIINYDGIKKLLSAPDSAKTAKRQATKNRRHARQGVSKVAWDVVVTDESHYLANPVSQRSAALERIVAGPARAKKPAWPIRLSATAGSNPAQLAYLHRGLAWRTHSTPRRSITMEQFVQWCQRNQFSVAVDRFDRLSWSPGDNKDEELDHMKQLLLDGTPIWGIRRRPEKWPEQQRILTPVELSPHELDLYEESWAEFQQAMKRIEKAQSKKSGTPSEQARQRAQGLAAQTRYRQKAGLLRVPHTAAFIADLVDKGHQVGVSCEYMGSVQALQEQLAKKKLKVGVFTGHNRNDREQQRIDFQQGKFPVIIFSPCEGFSLHAGEKAVKGNEVPRSLIVAEPRWSPKQSLQIEGRCHRDGQDAAAYYAYAEDTIEQRVVQVVIDGIRTTKRMVGDSTDSLQSLAQALGVNVLFK